MMKKVMLILSCLFLSVGLIYSQTITVNGVVVDDSGIEVVGASVVLKGTTTGAVTDIDGKFSLNVPSNSTLLFSLLGMKKLELKATPNMAVVMENDEALLDEVVVTAIGISRATKALGYAVSSVKGEDLLKARESNVINSLSGKVAGVRVTSASGGLGASAKIIIRGANSLDGNNQPLFVIDGMPIDNGSPGSAVTNVVSGSVDTGNRAGDINPDDVESMAVLKGAAATALYGSRAKNGAIIITTKKGVKGTKLSVEVNSSTRFESVLKFPEFQNSYSQGVMKDGVGAYDLNYSNGWGAAIKGQTEKNFLDQDVPLQSYDNNVEDFYQTGQSYINSISLSGGSEQADYRVGLTAMNQSGILPETSLNRYNFSANAGYNFSKNLSSRTIFSYITTSSHGRPTQSSNDPNIITSTINGFPRNLDINLLKNNWINPVTGEQIGYDTSEMRNNPYWILNKNKFKGSLERVIASETLTYTPVDWISITNNLGIDYYAEKRKQITSKGTFGGLKGKFVTNDIQNQIINNDLMVTLTRNLTSDLEIKVIGGHNINQRIYQRGEFKGEDLIIDGLYTPTNAVSTSSPVTQYEKRRLFGVFGDVGFAYRNYLYLNITGRNDWSSTLPKENRSYFYPSISTSFVFTELMQKNEVLNFGNLRVNLAQVGSDENPYQLDYVYTVPSTYFIQYTDGGVFPHMGLVGATIPRIYPKSDLKPQKQTSFEIGTNLKFFDNRLGIDFTYYNINTKDQIVSIDVPLSTGYFAKKLNVGQIQNKGIELTLNIVPIETKNFVWHADINFAKNTQKVVELIADTPELSYNLASGWSSLQVQAKKGESFGLYGNAWERNDKGEFVIDPKTGLRQIVSGQRLGDVAPKWTMGISNSFSYKGFNLSFLLDFRKGGSIYSGTVSNLRVSGLAEETQYNRENAFIDNGVVLNANGDYVPNTVPVKDMQAYWQHQAKASNTEGNIFDASYIKLRELRIGYQIPSKWTQKLLIRKAEIAFEGRNLWIIKDHIPHIDPETGMFGVNSAGEGVEFNSLPSTRSLGVNLRLNF